MANTSATGGWLLPATMPSADSDRDFRRIFGSVLAGLTGLDGSLIRPRWQTNPPPRPANSENWIGFGIQRQIPDDNGSQRQYDADMTLTRYERVELLLSFYGPAAAEYAGIVRDGLEVAQNRDECRALGVAYQFCGPTIAANEFVDLVWYERRDMTITFDRQIDREYPVLPFVAAQGEIVTEPLPPILFEVVQPETGD